MFKHFLIIIFYGLAISFITDFTFNLVVKKLRSNNNFKDLLSYFLIFFSGFVFAGVVYHRYGSFFPDIKFEVIVDLVLLSLLLGITGGVLLRILFFIMKTNSPDPLPTADEEEWE